MPLIALDVTIPENPFRLARAEMRKLTEAVLDDSVRYFAEQLLPERFAPRNDTRFGHEKRNKVYREQIKRKAGTGQGKHVNLQLSGKSMRQAKHLYRITGKQRKKLKVTVPAYFTKPFTGTFRDPQSGRVKRVTRQPNKVAELQRVDSRDKTRLQKRAHRKAREWAPRFATTIVKKSRRKTFRG